MSICPFMSYRFESATVFCTSECELYNRHLKGCHISSFVINANKFMLYQSQTQSVPEKKKMPDRKSYAEKYAGMNEEEKHEEIFDHGKE